MGEYDLSFFVFEFLCTSFLRPLSWLLEITCLNPTLEKTTPEMKVGVVQTSIYLSLTREQFQQR